mmetsp:Transcript_3376/g.12204  ORF Transcript_3376/g.12204 Transcript_3376/m.12204 type:complete len:423 (-) Transcript_3376:203-1471(-)
MALEASGRRRRASRHARRHVPEAEARRVTEVATGPGSTVAESPSLPEVFDSVADMIVSAIGHIERTEGGPTHLRSIYNFAIEKGRIQRFGQVRELTRNRHWKCQIRHSLYKSGRFQRVGEDSPYWRRTESRGTVPQRTPSPEAEEDSDLTRPGADATGVTSSPKTPLVPRTRRRAVPVPTPGASHDALEQPGAQHSGRVARSGERRGRVPRGKRTGEPLMAHVADRPGMKSGGPPGSSSGTNSQQLPTKRAKLEVALANGDPGRAALAPMSSEAAQATRSMTISDHGGENRGVPVIPNPRNLTRNRRKPIRDPAPTVLPIEPKSPVTRRAARSRAHTSEGLESVETSREKRFQAAALQALQTHKEPLDVKALVAYGRRSGLIPPAGRGVCSAMASYLHTDIGSNAQSPFRMTDDGLFGLREW